MADQINISQEASGKRAKIAEEVKAKIADESTLAERTASERYLGLFGTSYEKLYELLEKGVLTSDFVVESRRTGTLFARLGFYPVKQNLPENIIQKIKESDDPERLIDLSTIDSVVSAAMGYAMERAKADYLCGKCGFSAEKYAETDFADTGLTDSRFTDKDIADINEAGSRQGYIIAISQEIIYDDSLRVEVLPCTAEKRMGGRLQVSSPTDIGGIPLKYIAAIMPVGKRDRELLNELY